MDTAKKLAEALDQCARLLEIVTPGLEREGADCSYRNATARAREALSQYRSTPAAADARTFEQWYSKRYQYDFSAKPETWKHAAMCDAREVWDAAKASAPDPLDVLIAETEATSEGRQALEDGRARLHAPKRSIDFFEGLVDELVSDATSAGHPAAGGRARVAVDTSKANVLDAFRELLASAPEPVALTDPMDWPLPCDVTVGHGTMRKGVALRTLVMRMKVLYEMATGSNADEVAARTPEQRAAIAASQPAPVEAECPYYIGGPYEDGHYSLCEISTSRIVATSRPAAPVEAKAVPDGDLQKLLEQCLKPDEIEDTRQARVAELVRWFVRLAEGNANPKWLRGHAFELAYHAALSTPVQAQPELTVWFGSMPESCGRENWTVTLRRKTRPEAGSASELHHLMSGFQVYRTEYKDRARYEADRLRFLLGEIDKEPHILDYDADLHSGYVEPVQAQAVAVPEDSVTVPRSLIRRAQQAINWHLEPSSPDEHEATMRELAEIGWPEVHAELEAMIAAAPTPSKGEA
jgi:hypothetical protein